MSQERTRFDAVNDQPGAGWNGLYRLAGIGALLATLLVMVDIGMSFGGGDVGVAEMTTADWFALYQRDWFMGLRNLGFFNVISTIISIPLYLTLYRLHRKAAPAYAALALIIFLLGSAVYSSNNRALAMITLSSQYAGAQTEIQRTVIETAGTLTLAQAEDFTPGTFLGFFLSSTGTIGMMAVMLHARIFGKKTSLAGLVGASCLLGFTISVTFVPDTMTLAMIPAMIGGLLMMGWNVSMALAMFRLARPAPSQPARTAVLAR